METMEIVNAVPPLAQALVQYGYATAIVMLSIAVVMLWKQNQEIQKEFRGYMSDCLEKSTKALNDATRCIEQNNRIIEGIAVRHPRSSTGEFRVVGGE